MRLDGGGERDVLGLWVVKDDTRQPYRLQWEQWKLSEALLERLERSPNADVRFAATVVSASDRGDSVDVEIDAGGAREKLRTRYVVGCDGARSAIRACMGLPFEGLTYPETTLLVTTQFPFEEHLEGLSNVSYCWKADGNFSLLKVPGRWRVSVYPDENTPIEDQMTSDALNASLQDIVVRDLAYEMPQHRPYRGP